MSVKIPQNHKIRGNLPKLVKHHSFKWNKPVTLQNTSADTPYSRPKNKKTKTFYKLP